MAIKILSSTFNGIEGVLITVEVELSRGLPAFNIVGLADTSVRESKERVRSAIINSGYDFPLGKITVNLAPADIRKEGALLDLPIAIGILAATDQIDCKDLECYIIAGELSLSGNITYIRGALPIVIEGLRNNHTKFIVPIDNANECCLIEKSEIYPFSTLNQVTNYLKHQDMMPYKTICKTTSNENSLDFSEVIGQKATKRALEIACAGGHNIILFGPPGCGKSMLASRIPSILPELTYEESLEITKVYSITGKLHNTNSLMIERPFRNPHHTSTKTALVGGGNQLMPGEISLCHNGVLFLDELLEFKRSVLEVLREPLERKSITISRCSGSVSYPANFMLVASLNPCPCGYYLSKSRECSCTQHDRIKYLNKLSGPFLDRIDMFSFTYQHKYEEMTATTIEESSKSIKMRVEAARNVQRTRFEKDNLHCNADMSGSHIKRHCNLDASSEKILNRYFNKFPFSLRVYNRILKISRTIADLDNCKNISSSHVVEAISYRQFTEGEVI